MSALSQTPVENLLLKLRDFFGSHDHVTDAGRNHWYAHVVPALMAATAAEPDAVQRRILGNDYDNAAFRDVFDPFVSAELQRRQKDETP